MAGPTSKWLQDVLASVVAEQERCTRQKRRATRLVKQAQRAVRDSKRLHEWHIGRDRKRMRKSR